jgi:methylase of polypeptide subunit release factors
MLEKQELESLLGRTDELRAVVEYAGREGYTLERIARLLQADDPNTVLTKPGYYAFVCGDELAKQTSPLAVLVQLFLLGSRVRTGIYRSALPTEVREQLERLGLVSLLSDERVEGRITLVELQSCWFLSDKLFEYRGSGQLVLNRAPDAVMPPHESSLYLLRNLAQDARWTSFLDVGSGCGCQSILTRPRHARATGLDLNPRAVTFSALNAALNRRDVRFEVADCLTFEDGSRYDHIAFNTPSRPRYKAGSESLANFASELGYDFVFSFLERRLEKLLSPEGCCQVWVLLPVLEQQGTPEQMIRDLLPCSSRFHITLQVARRSSVYLSAADAARNRLPRGSYLVDNPSEAGALLEFLRARRVKELLPTLLTLRPGPAHLETHFLD